jgi:ribonuclease PH
VSVRASDRAPDELRPVSLELGVNRYAEGSCRIAVGDTQVICTASIEDRVPPFLVGSGEGWVTAEYGMLPRATSRRTRRERSGERPVGRSLEIQRLIGRSLRAVVDRKVFGDRTITIDCDVVQADGGTRCASVTGGFVALALALAGLQEKRQLRGYPLTDTIAAISVAVVAAEALLDVDFAEDSAADFDLNVVRTGSGRYVEIQGTAEAVPLRRERLDSLLALADLGTDRLQQMQREALGDTLGQLVRPRPAGS